MSLLQRIAILREMASLKEMGPLSLPFKQVAAQAAGNFTVCGVNNGTCICPVGEYFNSAGQCDYLSNSIDQSQSDFFVPPVPHLVDVQGASSNFSSDVLVGTGIALASWILLTTLLRFLPLHGTWFFLRRAVRWCDFIYSKRHWMDEQKCQVRHKTEAGGVASVGACIFIVGFMLSELILYCTFKPYTIQSVFPITNTTLGSYKNNLNFTVTVLSNMDCSQLQTYSLTLGVPPAQRTVPLPPPPNYRDSFNCAYQCVDSSSGPVFTHYCRDAVTSFDNYFLQMEFVDTVRPAAAYGFRYDVSTSTSDNSTFSITAGQFVAALDNSSVTMRGPSPNVLNFRFIPRVFRDPDSQVDSNLFEVFFHEFNLGDNFNTTDVNPEAAPNSTCQSDANCLLRESLSSPVGQPQLVVQVSAAFLTEYQIFTQIVQNRSVLVLLASLGGLYKLGILLFFLTMNMAERYIRSVRYDDKLLDRVAKKRLALYHWRKLRIAVKFGLIRQMAGDERGKELGSTFVLPKQTSEVISTAALTSATLSGAAPRRSGWFSWLPIGGSRNGALKHGGQSYPGLEEAARQEVAEDDPSLVRGRKRAQFADLVSAMKDQRPTTPHLNPKSLVKTASGFGTKLASGAEKNLSYITRRAKSVQRRHGYKYEDMRKGSQSEHTGTIVRSYKAPSWVPNYRELPHVPDFPPALLQYIEEKKQRLRDEDDSENSPLPPLQHPDPKELFHFLEEMDDYQARLRVDFLSAQTMVELILQRFRPHSDL